MIGIGGGDVCVCRQVCVHVCEHVCVCVHMCVHVLIRVSNITVCVHELYTHICEQK